jgi:hypothetical protein
MSDSQLFPWQATDEIPSATKEIKDPVSGASITLPRLSGLTVNEVLFAQWAVSEYTFLNGELRSDDPSTIVGLMGFCHRFICLRMGLADWVEDDLRFQDAPVAAQQSLSMTMPDGQRKAAPLHMLYLIYAFFIDEQRAWTSGKDEAQMMDAILAGMKRQAAIATSSTGAESTGISNEDSQTTPDSPDEPLADAPRTSSKRSATTSKPKTLAA